MESLRTPASRGPLPTPVCRHLRGERRVARDEWLDLLPPPSLQPSGRREAAGYLAAPLAFSEPASKTVSRSTSQSAGDAERKPGLGTSSNREESLPSAPPPQIGRKGSQVKLKEELGFHHKARADASEVARPSASPFQKPKVEARVRWRLSPPLGGRCSAGPALGAHPRQLPSAFGSRGTSTLCPSFYCRRCEARAALSPAPRRRRDPASIPPCPQAWRRRRTLPRGAPCSWRRRHLTAELRPPESLSGPLIHFPPARVEGRGGRPVARCSGRGRAHPGAKAVVPEPREDPAEGGELAVAIFRHTTPPPSPEFLRGDFQGQSPRGLKGVVCTL